MEPLQEYVKRVVLPTDIIVDERGLCDLELLLNGGFAPLTGYMGLADYTSCVNDMKLADDAIWTIPITLPVAESSITFLQTEDSSAGQKTVHIRDKTNALVAELTVTSVYKPCLKTEIEKVLGAAGNHHHPYAKYLLKEHGKSVYVGGVLKQRHSVAHYDFRRYRLTPADVKKRIQERGWKTVVGFQTRNPMHRSHYELTRQAMKDAAEMSGEPAHLIISPAVGPTQTGDVDYRVRVRCYERILPHYEEEPLLLLLPLAMRMAGPREAVWHACIRRNFGCTHFIVGRDHAGPSVKKTDGTSFYGPYDAHELLKKLSTELGITPVFGKNMLYTGPEHGFVQEGKTPEGAELQYISGTAFRQMLIKREPVPEWFCFGDVVKELHAEYRPLHRRGLCVYFTGLPCSGKSTLACALEAVLLECPTEERKVTVLDADIIRTHLSRGLGFSREDRQLNVRRIGYVASEIAKHGGICLVANIAPYKEDRDYNRQLIESAGGHYVEVHVSTPLEVCEARDIKELYKKARLGQIKQFTGISDPYEVPESPEFIVNSSSDPMGKVVALHDFLKKTGYCQ